MRDRKLEVRDTADPGADLDRWLQFVRFRKVSKRGSEVTACSMGDSEEKCAECKVIRGVQLVLGTGRSSSRLSGDCGSQARPLGDQ